MKLLCEHELQYVHSKNQRVASEKNDDQILEWLLEIRSSSEIEVGIHSFSDEFLIDPNVETESSELDYDKLWYYWRL